MEICPFMPSDVVVVRVKKPRTKAYQMSGPYALFGSRSMLADMAATALIACPGSIAIIGCVGI